MGSLSTFDQPKASRVPRSVVMDIDKEEIWERDGARPSKRHIRRAWLRCDPTSLLMFRDIPDAIQWEAYKRSINRRIPAFHVRWSWTLIRMKYGTRRSASLQASHSEGRAPLRPTYSLMGCKFADGNRWEAIDA